MRIFSCSIITSFLLLVVKVRGSDHEGESYGDTTFLESRIIPYQEFSRFHSSSQSSGFQPIHNPYLNIQSSPRVIYQQQQQQQYKRSDASSRNLDVAEQNFFPSFFRSAQQQQSSRQNFKGNAASIAGRYSTQNYDQKILGSGDFAVLRGGTFYPNNRYKEESEEFYGGRPYARPLKGRKQAYYPDDPFEHFTDFADINAGNDAAYSHHEVVYVNGGGAGGVQDYLKKNQVEDSQHPGGDFQVPEKDFKSEGNDENSEKEPGENLENSVKDFQHSHHHPAPNNILEQLQLIDEEKKEENVKKLSKFKQKLKNSKNFDAKKEKSKKFSGKFKKEVAEYTDPLIALS